MQDLKTMNSSSFRFKPIDGYLSEYFNKTHVNYLYNLSGNNINATLYKVDVSKSTVSEGAGNKVQTIGPESPYRFLMIEAVPIFNVSRLDIPVGWNEDQGYTTEMRLECIVQPSVVAVDVDDYLSLDYSSYKNLWRVIEAQPDCFEEVYYTKLTLAPTQYSAENISYQVRKRMAYVFESGAVIDKTVNDNLNDILLQMSEYYKRFLAEFYAKQGIFIRREILNTLSSKYFKFKELPSDVVMYNYFFKRFLDTAPITVYINQKERLSIFFKYTDEEKFLKDLYDDEAKFLFKFMLNLEDGLTASKALNDAVLYFTDLHNKVIESGDIKEIDKFSDPLHNFFNFEFKFYTLLSNTFELVESIDNIVDPNSKNTVKLLNNFKKIVKNLNTTNSTDTLLKTLLSLFLFKSIPFKRISYGVSKMEYGV